MIRLVALLATAALGATACSAQSSPSTRQSATRGPAPLSPPYPDDAVPKNAPEGTVANVPATAGRANSTPVQPPVAVAEIGRFDAPFALAFLPDGQLLVTEKGGKLKRRAVDGTVVEIGGVPTIKGGGQGGLLDVAVSPRFATDRQVYLTYSEEGPGGSQLTMARGVLRDGASPALADVRVLWRSGASGPGGQFGANILFAPDGKSLFLSSGERQRFTPAQDPQQALGKILRLTLDGKAWPGNPAYQAGGVRAMTWSTGHRNPYGLAFDGAGRLWEEEMGPRGGDELNLIQPGKNYGWPLVSNGDNYSGQPIPDHPSRPDLAAPALWWNPSISPGGMIHYSGTLFPDYRGSLFIAALSGNALIRVALDGASARVAEQWDMGTRIRDVAQAPDGAIWLLTDGRDGRLLRLTPR